MASQLLLLSLAVPAHGYTVFHTFCTTPNVTASFVTSPNSRATLDILWSCLFTIIACTWTIQHLNVPEQRNGRDPGWKGDIKWQLRGLLASVKWMITTILAPELILRKTLEDLVAAYDDLKALQKFGVEDGVEWTLTHSLFANMGGFVVRGNDMQESEKLAKMEAPVAAGRGSLPDTISPGSAQSKVVL